jgi:hypothetical protein
MNDELSDLPALANADALMRVEVLSSEFVPDPERGVTLRGEAALDVTDSLGNLIRTGTGVARRATTSTYRLVPSEKAAQGLADGSLRWATASKGDASVLIKDEATGRIASHGSLQKVKPNPAKFLGPAAWEAMAMATQQHYLVEINDKLESIERGVDEVLSRMDDDKLGTLEHASRIARTSLVTLDQGGTLSPNRIQDVREAASRAEEAWHQLHRRAARTIAEYQRGDRRGEDVEQAWALLLKATQALGECSSVLMALPHATLQELEDVSAEERERAVAAIEHVRALAGELQLAHGHWSATKADWDIRFTRNPAKRAVRQVRRTAPVKPKQQPLDYTTAWRASQLGAPPRPPDALLVTVNDDGTVGVAPERVDETPLVG